MGLGKDYVVVRCSMRRVRHLLAVVRCFFEAGGVYRGRSGRLVAGMCGDLEFVFVHLGLASSMAVQCGW